MMNRMFGRLAARAAQPASNQAVMNREMRMAWDTPRGRP
jgi:hypothetical protein